MHTPSNSNIRDFTFWRGSHLRENEPAVELSHERLDEQKEGLLAHPTSQKLQEEVALRKKKRKRVENLHTHD